MKTPAPRPGTPPEKTTASCCAHRADASRCLRSDSEDRRVSAGTITSLVRDQARLRLASLDGFRFCPGMKEP